MQKYTHLVQNKTIIKKIQYIKTKSKNCCECWLTSSYPLYTMVFETSKFKIE